MTGRPQGLTQRPDFKAAETASQLTLVREGRMAADALSDVLKTVRLTGATFFDVVAKAPWVAEQPPREAILPKVLAGAEHLIAYHAVTEGRCFGNIVGEEAVEVKVGEVIVFTKGDPHVMSSHPGMRADPKAADRLQDFDASQLPFTINIGGNGAESAKLVCGFLACDARPFNPLLNNLPPVIIARNDQPGDSNWLGQFIHVAMMESSTKRLGGESVLARLSELMFIEVVRRQLETLPPDRLGWLAGLRDPFVGKAISAMHANPSRNWTIEDLGKVAGLSRSVLAERFTLLVGMPPMQYLAKWRMQIAAGLLTGGANMAAVAAEVGYGSEAAFSRAFKKVVGTGPSAWRRRHDRPNGR